MEKPAKASQRVEVVHNGNKYGISMDYVTVDIVYSQAIPDLFTPGITTSTRCARKGAYF